MVGLITKLKIKQGNEKELQNKYWKKKRELRRNENESV